MAKRKKGKRKMPAYVEEMLAQEKAGMAAATAAAASGVGPVVNMDVFTKPAIETPVEAAISFLAAHDNKRGVRDALQGIKLSALQRSIAANGAIGSSQEAHVLEVATKMGWEAPSA